MHKTNNWYAGFIDIIIKLTSVAWKLFSSTCWVYRAHCMKNLELVWSPWSPADHNLFQLVLGAEKDASISKMLPKNFHDYTTCCWWFTSNLWQFYGDLVAIWYLVKPFLTNLSCCCCCIALPKYVWWYIDTLYQRKTYIFVVYMHMIAGIKLVLIL